MTHGQMTVAGLDETAEFKMTCEAMSIMGISPEDQSGMVFTRNILDTIWTHVRGLKQGLVH